MFPSINGNKKRLFEESEYSDLAEEMTQFLTKLGATGINHEKMRGYDKSGISNEKMKVLFTVNEKELAVNCYNEMSSFSKTNLFGHNSNYLNIFYIKDGPTLVRYGDEAA